MNLIFTYGTMGSSKTANALMTRFQYIESGIGVTLLKPSTDTRDGVETLRSRIGVSAEAIVVHPNDDIIAIAKREGNRVIIADESQFFTTAQVEQLRLLADEDYDVWCYGLKTDFQSHLFEGSKRLLELATATHELDSVCKCGRKAIINARIDAAGNVVTGGAVVVLGTTNYRAMCHKCWRESIKGGVDNG